MQKIKKKYKILKQDIEKYKILITPYRSSIYVCISVIYFSTCRLLGVKNSYNNDIETYNKDISDISSYKSYKKDIKNEENSPEIVQENEENALKKNDSFLSKTKQRIFILYHSLALHFFEKFTYETDIFILNQNQKKLVKTYKLYRKFFKYKSPNSIFEKMISNKVDRDREILNFQFDKFNSDLIALTKDFPSIHSNYSKIDRSTALLCFIFFRKKITISEGYKIFNKGEIGQEHPHKFFEGYCTLPTCGKIHIWKNRNGKYCSDACRAKDRRLRIKSQKIVSNLMKMDFSMDNYLEQFMTAILQTRS